MVNNIFLYKLFIGVKKINGHSGVNFSFKDVFILAGYLMHIHREENSLIVLYCHEKLDPPALLRKFYYLHRLRARSFAINPE